MSPSPAASTSSSSATPTSSSLSDATPKNDHRLLAVVVVLVIVAAFLIAYVMYITVRLKRRQESGDILGPTQGTVINDQDHPAANITPFGAVGPNAGSRAPRFKHNPGEDMRIALRRPDGAWHFTDSRTPFTPLGIKEIDVVPSPVSSSVGFFSSHPRLNPEELRASRYIHHTHTPPPPVYFREPCVEHFDDHRGTPH
ncbi:hypothetical protein BDN70DRAFT_879166 [Pholiota conissans]|uniref:Uncharacterized protein n=1 Tax=Pholiota conissans TaxID=109636 RepID=A0A9P5Z2U8_9AGAR|nr:hypothetical protein BDN70DRAFT_879166 [Pholiota conissans]